MKTLDKPIQEALQHIRGLLSEHLEAVYVFHNYDHTLDIVEVCLDLVQKAEIDQEEKERILFAALFYHAGFTTSNQDYIKHSISLTADYLRSVGYRGQYIEKVTRLISNVAKEEKLNGESEKILHDAVWSFLWRKSFKRKSTLLRIEKEETEHRTYSSSEWYQYIFDLQLQTKCATPWAQEKYAEQRSRNIAALEEELSDANKESIRKSTGKDFGRGVDTMFRVTIQNHMDLSSLADGKANMIISINTLVLSILITAGSAGYSMTDYTIRENVISIIPGIILLISSLLAIVFAVFSAIPNISRTLLSQEQIKQHQISLLYFGNFLQLSQTEFVDYLRELKTNQEILYDDMAKDLYNLGKVLERKYRLIKLAYRVFVGGLILSVLTALIIFFN